VNYRKQKEHGLRQNASGEYMEDEENRPPPQEAQTPSMPNVSRQKSVPIDESYGLSHGLQKGDDGPKNLVKSLLSTSILSVRQMAEMANQYNLWHDPELEEYFARWVANITTIVSQIPREPVMASKPKRKKK
jgi:hypothetical protein